MCSHSSNDRAATGSGTISRADVRQMSTEEIFAAIRRIQERRRREELQAQQEEIERLKQELAEARQMLAQAETQAAAQTRTCPPTDTPRKRPACGELVGPHRLHVSVDSGPCEVGARLATVKPSRRHRPEARGTRRCGLSTVLPDHKSRVPCPRGAAHRERVKRRHTHEDEGMADLTIPNRSRHGTDARFGPTWHLPLRRAAVPHGEMLKIPECQPRACR